MADREAKRPRILTLSPAGVVYDHDKVQARPQPQESLENNYFNIGDMVVYDSTLKLLDYDKVEGLEITNFNDGLIEHYKTFDFIIVRASNFIHNEMHWDRAIELLERTGLPIYATGVGGQSAGDETYELKGDNLRLWQIVSERSKVIGVRGTFTAELLERNGIKNAEIVGCPSLFRHRKRDLQIRVPETIGKVAFSSRREASSTYTRDIENYLRIQRDFLVNTARRFDTTLTTHGEVEEKAFHFRNEGKMAEAEAMFRASGWWTPETEEELARLYREHMFFFLRVEDYDAFIRQQDYAIGYRVHGVLPALASGVPGILVKYDSRSTELADSLDVPSLTLHEAPENVEALLRDTSFETFNRRFAEHYDRMKSALERNGLPHRL